MSVSNPKNPAGWSPIGIIATVLFVILSVVSAFAGLDKLLKITWLAFLAMALAAPLGAQSAGKPHPRRMVWGYGLASGAMLTSASVFLIPHALEHHTHLGGFGIALGIVVGFAIHTLGHGMTHLDLPIEHTTSELSIHSMADGLIVGAVYATMPELGLLLGLAIISHKGPAGYAAGRRLREQSHPVSALLLPAAATGLTALPVGLFDLQGSGIWNSIVFGFAAGVFLHVALDFLPRCEIGGEVYEMAELSETEHDLLDKLRIHAVISTTVGGLFVFGAWMLIHG